MWTLSTHSAPFSKDWTSDNLFCTFCNISMTWKRSEMLPKAFIIWSKKNRGVLFGECFTQHSLSDYQCKVPLYSEEGILYSCNYLSNNSHLYGLPETFDIHWQLPHSYIKTMTPWNRKHQWHICLTVWFVQLELLLN